MPKRRDRLKVPKPLAGQRLDRVLEGLFPDLSRSQLQKLVRRGAVQVAGKPVIRSNGRINGGVEISLERDVPAPTIQLLHEDDAILVAVKPAGMLTHAADRSDDPDLAALLDQSHGPLPTSRGLERPGIVHRLDKDTSGILVVARTEEALAHLQDQFRARSVTKHYLALVSEVPVSDTFTVDAPLGPVPGALDRQQVDMTEGKEAITDVEVLERFAHHALVRCSPRTGRRHQLRVHLTERGHPILTDPLYGTKRARPLPAGIAAAPRLALHAESLAFDHPTTGERLTFTADLAPDLAATLTSLRGSLAR